MSLDILVIVLAPFGLVVAVLSFVTLNRYIAYKERVALAERGFTAQELEERDARGRHGNRGVLWGGVITMMSGLALLLSLATLGMGYWLIAGLLPLFVGLGMLLIYYVTSGAPPQQHRGPATPSPADESPWQDQTVSQSDR